ncbi:hypothetical protein UlMin_020042 [Ulmus minor]
MTEHKRSPCSVDQSNFTSLSSKCQKPDLSISSKDKKENLATRIVALQQLVSPYGKTDTASVLNEAMEYIQFLHEQVQLTSTYVNTTDDVYYSATSNDNLTNNEEVEDFRMKFAGSQADRIERAEAKAVELAEQLKKK